MAATRKPLLRGPRPPDPREVSPVTLLTAFIVLLSRCRSANVPRLDVGLGQAGSRLWFPSSPEGTEIRIVWATTPSRGDT